MRDQIGRPNSRLFRGGQATRRLLGSVTAALALMPASAAAQSPLTGEQLFVQGGFIVEPGSFCNPDGTGELHFSASGAASGPYPGTFTETGSLTFGPRPSPSALNTVTAFTSAFTISSGSGNVSGTKTLSVATVPPALGFPDFVNMGECNQVNGFGQNYFIVHATYVATITTLSGMVTDRGSSVPAGAESRTISPSNFFSEGYLALPLGPLCEAAPVPGCLEAAQARISSSEKTAGKEKLKLQWKKLTSATTQGAFGDPVTGTTRVALCLYSDGGTLLLGVVNDRAGQSCGGKPCWAAKGTKGYAYKDKAAASDGITRIGYDAGGVGKGKAAAAGANDPLKGQTALPTGVVAALSGNTHPRIQLVSSDGFCVGATMTEATRDDGLQYQARKK